LLPIFNKTLHFVPYFAPQRNVFSPEVTLQLQLHKSPFFNCKSDFTTAEIVTP